MPREKAIDPRITIGLWGRLTPEVRAAIERVLGVPYEPPPRPARTALGSGVVSLSSTETSSPETARSSPDVGRLVK